MTTFLLLRREDRPGGARQPLYPYDVPTYTQRRADVKSFSLESRAHDIKMVQWVRVTEGFNLQFCRADSGVRCMVCRGKVFVEKGHHQASWWRLSLL